MEWQNLSLLSRQPQTFALAHTHKVEDCNMFKKMNTNKSDKPVSTEPLGTTNQVTVDKNTLKTGMPAIFPSRDFDTDNLADVLAATMAGIK